MGLAGGESSSSFVRLSFAGKGALLIRISSQEKKKKGKKSKKGEKGDASKGAGAADTATATNSGSGELSRRHAHAVPRVEEVEDE